MSSEMHILNDTLSEIYTALTDDVSDILINKLIDALPAQYIALAVNNETEVRAHRSPMKNDDYGGLTLKMSSKNLDNGDIEITMLGCGNFDGEQTRTFILAGKHAKTFKDMMIACQLYDHLMFLNDAPALELNEAYDPFVIPNAPIRKLTGE